jgi:hypothetical protein
MSVLAVGVPLGNSISCCELRVSLRDQDGGWDHREVLLSLIYRLMRCLFDLLAVLVRPDLSKNVELLVLRQENQVLRRQLRGRPRWDHAGRLWLTALSRLVNRSRSDTRRPALPPGDERARTTPPISGRYPLTNRGQLTPPRLRPRRCIVGRGEDVSLRLKESQTSP